MVTNSTNIIWDFNEIVDDTPPVATPPRRRTIIPDRNADRDEHGRVRGRRRHHDDILESRRRGRRCSGR